MSVVDQAKALFACDHCGKEIDIIDRFHGKDYQGDYCFPCFKHFCFPSVTPVTIPGIEEWRKLRPSHYNEGKIEAIAVIEDWKLGFCLGNTIKYICRAGKKAGNPELKDLEKARWYLDRYIQKYLDRHISKLKENKE
jgi:hypothetical protein